MSAIIYYAALPFIYGISYLPFRLLYVLSDVIYLILYRGLGYRRKVVAINLKNAFPGKSDAERLRIEQQFYRYFCDLILETLKTLTIQPEALKKRVIMRNPDVFQQYYDQGKSVIVVMGHLGNWELGGARFSQEPYHKLYVIYHPMRNRRFNQLIYHMRTRLGNRLYAMKEAFKGMVQDRGTRTATAFIADQTPSPHHAYWTTFLHQDTPVYTGTAKISRKMKYPVIYINIDRPSRGQYAVNAEVLVEKPETLSEDDISEMHTRRLEKDILAAPHLWLWTHRRWKHKRPE